ncbi:enoyl-CoA hydratase [Corticibacter populi]|uniref:Enoyl-CoA hydratase n=1 Tax=Corticibacter populi TaxID=1550736 RepID=A0A3M6QP64_9BURK|nr:enoyl-CoA hydratase [Corticibacter populi]RMX04837.1 enoyl-CoA hydratase [Corticibacter populi]RZS33744.1 enoyl-CoA hydratase/carnithine racemase [Corticibacter populi]
MSHSSPTSSTNSTNSAGSTGRADKAEGAGILRHAENGVLTLTLSRLDKKNAFTQVMYGLFADAFEQAADDAAVRVVVVQGDVTVFSAGNDIADFQQAPRDDGDRPVFRFLRAIAAFPKPVLAAVCGPAVGIGTTLLLHCDLVYAGDNAAFALPFVNLGLCPEAGSSLLLPRLMGHQRASEALLLGEPFFAEAAQEVGLVNRIVPPQEANAMAQIQAVKLAAKPLAALLATKRLLKGAQQAEVLARIDEEARIFGELLQSPAAREAFSAFMEKRKPDFSRL